MSKLYEPLVIRGFGQPPKPMNLDERLRRCELELRSVLKLDEKQIEVYEVELRNLRTVYLDKNVQFACMVEELRTWNQDVRAYKEKGKPLKKAAFRYILIKCLNSNLREVVNTKDRQVQLFYLKQLMDWYESMNNAFIQNRPSTGQRSNTQSSNNRTSLKNLMKPIQQSNGLEDFINQWRSKHNELDPPEDRIKEFSKKELSMRDISTPSVTGGAATRPATVMFNTSRPNTQGSFGRPSTNHMSARVLSTVDGNSIRGISRGGMNSAQSQFREPNEILRSPGVISSSPWNYSGSFGFFQSGKGQNFQSVKIIGTKSEEDEGEEQGQNEEGNRSGEDDLEGRTHPGIFQPRRKEFNNDMNTVMGYAETVQPAGEMKSTYLNYNPSENVNLGINQHKMLRTQYKEGKDQFIVYVPKFEQLGEMRLEKIWLQNRNKAVQEKREYEELENHILNWASNKGLLEQDINRQNELTAAGSKFENIGDHLPSSIPKEELNEKNCQVVEEDNETKEEKQLFNNYLNIMKLPDAQKIEIAHAQQQQEQESDDDQNNKNTNNNEQLLKSRHSSALAGNQNEDIEILDNQNDELQQNDQTTRRSKKRQKKQSQDDNQDSSVVDQIIVPIERPKTHYISLRSEINTVSAEPNPFVGIEQIMKANRLAEVRKLKQKIIGNIATRAAEDMEEEEVQRRKQTSLQTYYNKATNKKCYRPFSSFYNRVSVDSLKMQELTEIQKVRNSFAKKGIKCSLQTISQSLSIPQGLPKASLILPQPGSMLLSNPFLTFGKKPKSSKKKKTA